MGIAEGGREHAWKEGNKSSNSFEVEPCNRSTSSTIRRVLLLENER